MERGINVPLSFEHLLSLLFGKIFYHGFVGTHTLGEWKKELIKLIKATERAIKFNIDKDDFHRNDMVNTCGRSVENLRSAKSFDEVNTFMLEFCMRIIFMLLGHIPDNWDKKSTSHINSWKLDKFRKLVYLRTPEHKANLILSLADKFGYSEHLPKERDLFRKRHFEFGGDTERFLHWFKNNYRDVYNEIV